MIPTEKDFTALQIVWSGRTTNFSPDMYLIK